MLESFGVPHRLVDAREAKLIEPALADAVPLFGGLHCRLTKPATAPVHRQARGFAAPRGVAFQFDTKVERLAVNRAAGSTAS